MLHSLSLHVNKKNDVFILADKSIEQYNVVNKVMVLLFPETKAC